MACGKRFPRYVANRANSQGKGSGSRLLARLGPGPVSLGICAWIQKDEHRSAEGCRSGGAEVKGQGEMEVYKYVHWRARLSNGARSIDNLPSDVGVLAHLCIQSQPKSER